MDETYGVPQRSKWTTDVTLEDGRVDTSFASEVQSESDNPCDNTKMVM